MAATWSILTPSAASGAIAIIELSAAGDGELNAALERLHLGRINVGVVVVRDLLGVDRGVVARWSESCLHLMPHGGVGIVRALAARLMELGISRQSSDAMATFPEVRTDLEARMLATLARATSPLAIDLLLDQPRRWGLRNDSDPELDRILNRLIDPPLVAAIGPPNVGKSTLCNALAGRAIAIVADEPGTTRDHVGVMLDLGGLVVRYLDTPGVRATEDAIECEAQEAALRAAGAADLILLMGDATAPPPEVNGLPATRLRIALRADMGMSPWRYDLAVSAHTGAGIAQLVAGVRECLVPTSALSDPRPWRL